MAELSPKARITKYINTNPGWSTISIFSIIFLIIGLGCVLLPEIFWDQFVWRYFWGPVVADAEDRAVGGITEGYNIVSTLSYGIILAGAILVIYRLIVVLDIEMNKWFFLAVIPYILFGGFARALEDAMLFKTPGSYIFISPVIYVFTGLMTVGLMVISHFISRKMINSDRKQTTKKRKYFNFKPSGRIRVWLYVYAMVLYIIYPAILAVFTFWVHYRPMAFYIPLLIVIFAITFVTFHINIYPERKNSMALLFGGFGAVLFSFPATYVGLWFTSPEEWLDVYLPAPTDSVTLRPEGLAIIIILALIATAVWAGAAYIISHKTKWKQAALFGSGVNLALVFGQFTDASATFIAIDYYSYWEKHVLPGFLIGVLDTAAVMFVLKAIALFFAIYVLDIYLKNELVRYRKIVPLIKIAVMVLGLAPGTRDMLRLAMGV